MAVPHGALALIPARGGSKGIPGKNLQMVDGVPLVCRSIHAAQASKGVGRVVVSTDDDAIAAAAAAEGAIVIRRPAAIAGDTASSESALLHALDALEQQGPLEAKLVFLQCTSPFTTGAQIDAVLAALKPGHCNSSFAVTPWHGFLWRADGRGINHDPGKPRQRRQDLEPAFLETGAIYTMNLADFRRCGSRFCPPTNPVVLEQVGPEIDTPEDLALCRRIAALKAE
ncbi:acylneuraminate cytidylyltransferase [Synechococcus sp. KORDI-52]|uniref:acylneuraminate cytidylyltransferase family protein n=1 Tax=Synechococcus sp. KORDI-52 TaxID=585425 RepID=UPI0004E059F7|nr:acylneuraminate cytidylyltransferase family protein [Synechococcus sp. KORDI-52]AII48502.1 acylneuraminate cytidylyltransferase [Synechococcus sp. KORDI-52]